MSTGVKPKPVSKTKKKTAAPKQPVVPQQTVPDKEPPSRTIVRTDSGNLIIPTRRPGGRPPLVRSKGVASGLSDMRAVVEARQRVRDAEAAKKAQQQVVKTTPVKQLPPTPVQKTTPAPQQTVDTTPTTVPVPVKQEKQEVTQQEDAPAPPQPKNKRDALISNSAMNRQLDTGWDNSWLALLHSRYYSQDGVRNKYAANVYNQLGEGDPAYVAKPVTKKEFEAFKKSSPVIEAQGMWQDAQDDYANDMVQYQKDMEAWLADTTGELSEPELPQAPPKDLDEAVARGDYFHVHNTNLLRPDTQDTRGRGRRIVVNVTNQAAGLKVSEALSGLFSDPVVSPYFDHYKIFLTQQTDEETVKHDKLVIYYEVPPGTKGDKDDIGDRIAATVDKSIAEGDYSDMFAPFYSRIGRGMAWAEEPGSYVAELQDSFTGTRAKIINDVLNDRQNNSVVKTPDDFIERVRAKFRARFVNPQAPHLHLTGRAPWWAQTNERKGQDLVPRPPQPTVGPPTLVIPQPQPTSLTAPQPSTLTLTSPRPDAGPPLVVTTPPPTLTSPPGLTTPVVPTRPQVVTTPPPTLTTPQPQVVTPPPTLTPTQLQVITTTSPTPVVTRPRAQVVTTTPTQPVAVTRPPLPTTTRPPIPPKPQGLLSPQRVPGPSAKPAAKVATRLPVKQLPPVPTTGNGPVALVRRHTN